MSSLSHQEAIRRMSAVIAGLGDDDLVEVHNELFPDDLQSTDDGEADRQALMKGIVDRVANGLEPEEIVDLWNVVFPKDRNVWYDEEAGALRVNEEPEHVEYTD